MWWACEEEGGRFTNLLGGRRCAEPSLGRIGADEPWEKRDGDSGPVLDRILPAWERGRRERRLIHEPLVEVESLALSATGWVGKSPSRFAEWRLKWPFWVLPTWAVVGRWRGLGGAPGEETWGGRLG